MLRNIACATVLVLALAAASFAYEIRTSRLDSWELAFTCKPPRVMELVEGFDLVEYTYVIYEVKNDTSRETDFYPTFQIQTDAGKVSDDGLYPSVESVIKKRFGSDINGARDVLGIIKPGETRRGVAIFKNIDPAADTLDLYVAGLTANYKVDTVDGEMVAMYRTYRISYARPGDEWNVVIDPVTLKDADWVWRQ